MQEQKPGRAYLYIEICYLNLFICSNQAQCVPVTGDTVPYSEAFLEYAPASSHGIYKGYLGFTFLR